MTDPRDAEIARLQADLTEAEQRGYAKAMEAERILYDRSLSVVWNDALEEAAILADRNYGKMIDSYAILALKKPIDQ